MQKFPEITVEKRQLIGRKVKQLRRQGIIPANLFGNKIQSIAIQVEEKVFTKIFDQVGETGIVEIIVGGEKYPSLVAGFARDSISNKILHIDFHHVSLKEKVIATIPLHITGEAPAVKEQGGVLNQSLHEIEVEALPTHLPESIEVDISGLTAIGDSISVSDLKVGSDVELKAEPETVVLAVAEPAPEEVAEEAAPAEAAAEEAAPAEEAKTE